MKKLWIYCLAWLCVATACSDPYENSVYMPVEANPIATYLEERPEIFSEWTKLLKHADLYNALNQADQVYTAFVPDNQAVQRFLQEKNITAVENMDAEYARTLIKNHVINAGIGPDDFIKSNKLSSPTLTGDYLVVSFGEQGGRDSVYINNIARVTEFAEDSVVANGYCYVLDRVLPPLVETLYDRIVENEEYSIFSEALKRTGWNERLNQVYDTTWYVSGSFTTTKRNFTVFAVSDATFAAEQINSIDGLISHLNAGTDYTDPDNALQKYVGFHILSGTYYMEDFYKMDEGTYLNTYSTNAKGEVLQVFLKDGEYLFGYDADKETYALPVIGKTDISAKNGIMHEVNYYLPVSVPQATTILWDLTDYDDVATWADEQLKKENPEGGFRVVLEAEQKVTLATSAVTSYTYKGMSAKCTMHPGAVSYFVAKTGSNWKLGTNSDCLALILGYMGWVQMESPTVLAGKYKVELQLWHAGTQDFIKNGDGAPMKISFDGEHEKTITPYKDAGEKNNPFVSIMYDEIEFTETTSHALKIVSVDPLASTNDKYRLYLDHVKFIPIND